MVKIKLKKCAYIFDGSNSTFSYGTREHLERKRVVNKYLKQFYENNNTLLDAELCGDGFNILIDNQKHYLKPQCVEFADCEHILNKLKAANLKNFDSEKFEKYVYKDSCTLYSKKFKTLSFEDFTTENKTTIEYIRIKFKNNIVRLVKDKENNLLWFDSYTLATEKGILNRLDASTLAKIEIIKVLNFIKNN